MSFFMRLVVQLISIETECRIFKTTSDAKIHIDPLSISMKFNKLETNTIQHRSRYLYLTPTYLAMWNKAPII
jgi:hypothetical protein